MTPDLIRRNNPELAWVCLGIQRAFIQRVRALERAYKGASFFDMPSNSVAQQRARKEFGFDV